MPARPARVMVISGMLTIGKMIDGIRQVQSLECTDASRRKFQVSIVSHERAAKASTIYSGLVASELTVAWELWFEAETISNLHDLG